MSQKISRRTRRRRQAIRESWAEVERRQIAQANWSAFLSAEIEIRSTGKMFATSVRIHPEHGVPVVTVATSNENVVGQIVFRPKVHDQKETGMSVAYSAAAAMDLLRAKQWAESESRRESLGIDEGAGGYYDLLPGGIDS